MQAAAIKFCLARNAKFLITAACSNQYSASFSLLTVAKEAPPTLSAVRAIDGFALRAAAEFRRSNGDFFFSPYSILSVLGMAYEGSAGVTREAMAKALSLDDGFHASLGALSAGLRERMDGQEGQPVLNDANRPSSARC